MISDLISQVEVSKQINARLKDVANTQYFCAVDGLAKGVY